MTFYLSKTDFMRYQTCPAYAWIAKHHKELIPPEEDDWLLQRRFRAGDEVEELALTLFPPGKKVQAFGPKAAEFTQTLADEGKQVIHQATALSPEGYMARADILVKDGDGWAIYEVKSGMRAKPEYIHDVAFQKLAFEKAGYIIHKAAVIHLNRSYVRDGELDPATVLKVTDVTKEVKGMAPAVEKDAAEAYEYLKNPTEPTTCPCINKPRYEHCPTFAHFHPDVPEYSIFHVSGLGKRVLKQLATENKFEITDLPDGTKLNDRGNHQVLMAKEGKPIIKEDQIKGILNGLQFPLYFLDYETTTGGLPLFEGCKPYQNMPFQYSVHVLEAPGAELKHYEYLATNQTANPVAELTDELQKVIGPKGTVIVWYKRFEMGCNEQMAEMHPPAAAFLKDVNERIFDLMEVFSDFHYVHPEFKGSTSIKNVLPVVVPELTYNDLAVQKGDRASALWEDSTKDSFDPAERDKLYPDLLEYCKLDTLAMVKIYEHLLDVVSGKAPAAVK